MEQAVFGFWSGKGEEADLSAAFDGAGFDAIGAVADGVRGQRRPYRGMPPIQKGYTRCQEPLFILLRGSRWARVSRPRPLRRSSQRARRPLVSDRGSVRDRPPHAAATNACGRRPVTTRLPR